MEPLNLTKNNLRKFGITMGMVLGAISLFISLRHTHDALPIAIISLSFFILAILPASLKYIYILWMRAASVLGWINTRLILSIMFYLIFTPTGLLMKLFGADLLERKINKRKDSYWIKKEKKDFSPLDYERQF
jgi:hypothetical protein